MLERICRDKCKVLWWALERFKGHSIIFIQRKRESGARKKAVWILQRTLQGENVAVLWLGQDLICSYIQLINSDLSIWVTDGLMKLLPTGSY